ncbi:MAG: DUF1127 domain-containing protein [Alphaproteobacteria bacterium]
MPIPGSYRAPAAPAAPALTLRPGAIVLRAVSVVLEWNDRYRQRVHLGQLDDRQLRDIGLTRGTRTQELDKPFWRG